MRSSWLTLIVVAVLAGGGCPQEQRNAFSTLTEALGASSSNVDEDSGSGGSGGSSATDTFRRTMTVTLENTHPDADLNVSVAAWVNTSSIRSAAQQDVLIANGYVQLTREVSIGTSFTLPPGTFVLNGSGVAGAQLHVMSKAGTPGDTDEISLVTPDVILIYLMPPTSCETPAYAFTQEGFPLEAEIATAEGAAAPIAAYAGANTLLGVKTLAQIDGYQCSPLKPGLFLKITGGARAGNEFFEGENVRAIFALFPNADGNTAGFIFE